MKIEQSILEEFTPYQEKSDEKNSYTGEQEHNEYEDLREEALRKIKKFIPQLVKLGNGIAKSTDPRLGIEKKYEEPFADLSYEAWKDELVSMLGVDPNKRLWAAVVGAILTENMLIYYEIRRENKKAKDVTIMYESNPNGKNGKAYYDQ